MREIKFRAWDKIKCKYLYNPTNMGYSSLNYIFQEDGSIVFEQYTGLKDKNGVEIYEGDIIYIAGYGDYIVEFPFIELYDRVLSGHEDDIEHIIGNIYENGDLLNDML